MSKRVIANASGFKVSAAGYDADTATPYQLLFDSSAGEVLSVYLTGTVLLSDANPYTINFTAKSYKPLVCVMGDTGYASGNPGTTYWVGGWYWEGYASGTTAGYPDVMDYKAGFDFTVTESSVIIYPGQCRSFRYTIFNTGFSV